MGRKGRGQEVMGDDESWLDSAEQWILLHLKEDVEALEECLKNYRESKNHSQSILTAGSGSTGTSISKSYTWLRCRC